MGKSLSTSLHRLCAVGLYSEAVVADADRPKRMTVDIDADIHWQIKTRAAQEGKTISEITREF